jgi:hypothetical protein
MSSAAPRALYRDLLRLHAGLPPVMRELGTRVLREEWRAFANAHRDGKATQAHWREFSAQWLRYKETLTAGPAAQPVEEADVLAAQLSPEQRVQLARLRDEARKLAAPPEAHG